MRIGYGYNRPDKDFDAWDCERVFVDTNRTEREERAAMFSIFPLIDSPIELFMFTKGELGYGKELQQLRKTLDAQGVSITYPPVKVESRGRKPKFNPTPEQITLFNRYWKDDKYSQAYCLRKISEEMGFNVPRHQAIYKLGNRYD